MASSAVFAEGAFTDIDESIYKESIKNLKEIGVINGYDDNTFRPKNPINRAELLKLVFEALGQSMESEGNCFTDVKDQWFAPYVCGAKELGIVGGYEDGKFRPGHQTSMVEALKIVVEAFGVPLIEVDSGGQWYEPYVEFAHLNGIFSRYAYLPGRSARREEIVFFVDTLREIELNGDDFSVKRESLSAGCGKVMPEVVPQKYVVDGVERSAIVVVPKNYEKNKPLSLVFGFHGRTNSNSRVRGYYGLEKGDNANVAIFVYPAGVSTGTSYNWANSGDPASDLRDYQFFDLIVEEITENYCVDEDEIYAVGHSLGGWFVNSLACARGNVLRAVATLGGGRSNSECTGPVAVMQWHNPKDSLAPFSSGEGARNNYVAQNYCSFESVPVEPSWGNCVEYKSCLQDAPVIFCPHTNDYDSRGKYYTHNWPKGFGNEIWKFFRGL